MTQLALHDHHPAHRNLRMLGADLVFQTPFLGEVARKSGHTLACNPDAERLLATGEIVGVWPEGFKGIGKPYTERYKLQRFGRGGFVATALRTKTPIIPCAIVGAEEIYPIIGNAKTLARLFNLPYFPITPTFPWLGPLGLVPLPSKWIIEFGEPIPTDHLSRRRRRRPDARLQPHRPGARDHPADAVPPPGPAPLRLPVAGGGRAPTSDLRLHRAHARRLHRDRRRLARLAVRRRCRGRGLRLRRVHRRRRRDRHGARHVRLHRGHGRPALRRSPGLRLHLARGPAARGLHVLGRALPRRPWPSGSGRACATSTSTAAS